MDRPGRGLFVHAHRPARYIGAMHITRSLIALVASLAGSLASCAQSPPAAGTPASVPVSAQPGEAPRPDHYVLLRCGTLLPVAGQEAKKNATLVIKNDRVDRVIDGLSGPDLSAETKGGASVQEIDLRTKFVMAGLIDCHVHLNGEYTPDRRLREITETDADLTIHTITNARKTLDAGFTTVRDLGARGDSILAVRDAVNRGEIVGPRILCAGKAISITGGHMDPTNGYRADVMGIPGTDQGVADGPDECLKAVRTQIKRNVDVIKIASTGGVLSISAAGLAQHYTDPELAAIVKAAHAMGRKVASHAHGTDGINAALRAGVDSIEHGSFQNEESIRLFKETKAWYVPTLLAGATTMENAKKPGYYLPMVAKKALEVGPMMQQSFRKAHDAGVRIAFGTDTGVSAHGQNAREFALMVGAGMPAGETLVCATINAATCLGIEKDVGTLEAGKAADVIGVDADPIKDVTTLERVSFVMKGGAVVKGGK